MADLRLLQNLSVECLKTVIIFLNSKRIYSCIVPAEFGVHFPPHIINVPKRTKLHLNEIGLTNTEICQSQFQPPISWKMCCFSAIFNTRVMILVTAIPQGC